MQFQPGGVILTRVRWNKPLWWPFNIGLVGYQLAMLSIGKVLGKVEADWREIWRAALKCHVRMITEHDAGDYWWAISFTLPHVKLERWSPGMVSQSNGRFEYLEPTFEISEYEVALIADDARAKDKKLVARKYDWLQLLSFLVNLPIWIIGSLLGFDCWGLQVITWFNLPGGREVCSTGVASLLKGCVKALEGLFSPFVIAMVSPCLYAIDKHWRKAA